MKKVNNIKFDNQIVGENIILRKHKIYDVDNPHNLEYFDKFNNMIEQNIDNIQISELFLSSKFDRIKYLSSVDNDWKNRTKATYGVLLKETNELIGNISFDNIDLLNKTGEVSCFIDINYKYENYGSEALNLLTNNFFEKGFKNISSTPYKYNISERHSLLKAGFFVKQDIDNKIIYNKQQGR